MPATTFDLEKARILYETGNSQRNIAKQLNCAYQTIGTWVTKYGWIKNRLREKVQAWNDQNILEEAQKLGITKKYILGQINQLVNAKKPIIDTDEHGQKSIVDGYDDNIAKDKGLQRLLDVLPGLKVNEATIKVEHIEPIIIKGTDNKELFRFDVTNRAN